MITSTLNLSDLFAAASDQRVMQSSKATDPTESALVAAARGGDPEAFAALVRQHQSRVFRLAGRFFALANEVEDIAQETFLTAWEKLDTFRGDAPLEAWLTRICLNLCYMRLRKTNLEVEPVDEERPLEGQRDRSGAVENRLDATRLLSHLSPADAFVLRLLHGEGWSVREIAERVGWSQANVKVRAFRARRKLRKLVEDDSR